MNFEKNKKENSSSKKENSFEKKNFEKKFEKKNNSKLMKGMKCFECQGFGHMAQECPTRLKRKEKVLKVTWDDSDSEESSASESETEQENFMAFTASVQSLKNESTESDTEISRAESSDEEESDLQETYNELYKQYHKLLKKEKKLKEKVKLGENEIKKQNDEIEELLKRNSEMVVRDAFLFNKLEESRTAEREAITENDKLKSKIECLEIDLKNAKLSFSKFDTGSKQLEEILSVQRPSKDTSGLGYDGKSKKKVELKFTPSNSKFLEKELEQKKVTVSTPVTKGKSLSYDAFKNNFFNKKEKNQDFHLAKTFQESLTMQRKFIPICHHCGLKGHIRPNCHKLYGLPKSYIDESLEQSQFQNKQKNFLSNRFQTLLNETEHLTREIKNLEKSCNLSLNQNKTRRIPFYAFKNHDHNSHKTRHIWVSKSEV